MGIVVPITQPQAQAKPQMPAPPAVFLAMAAAQTHAAGRFLESDPDAGPPMDITSQAQKADIQKKSNTWPEGTSPEVRKTFDDRLRAGDITRDQYNKAMRDPRQFQDNP